MLLTTPNELKIALRHEPKVTVHFHGTCDEAMLLHHPFAELADARAVNGMETDVRLSTTQQSAIDIESLFNTHADVQSHSFEVVASISCEEPIPCVAEFRKKLHIDKKNQKRMQPQVSCFSTAATGALYQARRCNPYKPYLSECFPQRITLLPPPAYQNFDSYHIESILIKKMTMELVELLNLNGYQVWMPRVNDEGMWNTSIAWSLEQDVNLFECTGPRDLGTAILSSSTVVAFHSEYSVFSSMLSVPTLTIYGTGVDFKRYAMADVSLPTYSMSLDRIQEANGRSIFSRICEIQSQLLPVC